MLAYCDHGGLSAYPKPVQSQPIGAGLEYECRPCVSPGRSCAVLGQPAECPSGRLQPTRNAVSSRLHREMSGRIHLLNKLPPIRRHLRQDQSLLIRLNETKRGEQRASANTHRKEGGGRKRTQPGSSPQGEQIWSSLGRTQLDRPDTSLCSSRPCQTIFPMLPLTVRSSSRSRIRWYM